MKKIIGILLFVLVFLTSVHSVSAQEGMVTSILEMIQNVFGDVLSPSFWTQANNQAAVLLKVLLWTLIFSILYPVSRKIPIFAERKGPAVAAVGVIAFISVIMIPTSLLFAIAAEYSGVAVFIFLALPVVGFLALSKELPDTTGGNIAKCAIFVIVLLLWGYISAKMDVVDVPFIKEIAGSTLWYLFGFIVGILALISGIKIFSSRGKIAGFGKGLMGELKGLGGEKFRPEAEAKTEERAEAKEIAKAKKWIQDAEKYLAESEALDTSIESLSEKEKITEEKIARNLREIARFMPGKDSLLASRKSLAEGPQTPETLQKLRELDTKLQEVYDKISTGIQQVNDLFVSLRQQMEKERAQIDKDIEDTRNMQGDISSSAQEVTKEITLKRAQHVKAQNALTKMQEQARSAKTDEITEINQVVRQEEKAFNEIQQQIQQLDAVYGEIAAMQQQAQKIIQKNEEVKELSARIRGLVDADFNSIREAINAFQPEAGGQQAANILMNIANNIEQNRKPLIDKKKELVRTIKREQIPKVKRWLVDIKRRLPAAMFRAGKV